MLTRLARACLWSRRADGTTLCALRKTDFNAKGLKDAKNAKNAKKRALGEKVTKSRSRAATLCSLPRRRLEMGRGRCRVFEAEGVFVGHTKCKKRKVTE